MTDPLPRWVTVGLLPVLNILAALALTGAVVWLIGADPVQAIGLLLAGAFGGPEQLGFTLYYATNFIFTGLAVALAFHGGLFNIGGEGQAYVGGLGVGLVALALSGWPWWAVLPATMVAGAAFGAAWAVVPGYLQAYRGSHVVITTILFNFIASALMTYLLVEVLIAPGQQNPESRTFTAVGWLPSVADMAAGLGWTIPPSPLNLAFVLALAVAAVVHVAVWHTRWGYELRVLGRNPAAAEYAGIRVGRMVVTAMALSGALAGLMAVNELLGVQHRIILDLAGGAGFCGIAVALIGRNHAVGVVLAAVLFGALYQGGAELSFDMPQVTRDMVVVIQGLVILFCGALENLFRPALAALFRAAPVPLAAEG